MKILQLTKKFPFPLKDGESIAVTTLTKSLEQKGCDVTLLSMNTVKHFVAVDELPTSFNHYEAIHTVFLDNRVTLWGAFANLFSKQSYHVSRYYYPEYRKKLLSLLKDNQFDIIQLETLFLAPYIDDIRRYSTAPIVMRSHNVEFEIWERIISNTANPLKKAYLTYLTMQLKRFELECLNKYDALVTVTQRDYDGYRSLGYMGGGMASPIGLDVGEYKRKKIDSTSRSISFIGSLDWLPNLEGLEWFIARCLPIIEESFPDVVLHIAGRNTPQSIIDLDSIRIKVHGEVDDARAFINDYPITVVPLLSGSGMRVKILEGMALGRVVVSTLIGAEGIHARDGQDILLKSTPSAFAEAIINMFENPHQMQNIGDSARTFIQSEFDQYSNADRLMEYYRGLLA